MVSTQGSYGHEKSWNLKMHFLNEKVIEFHILVQIFRAVLKLEAFSLSLSKNISPQRLGFQHLLVMEILKWSWKM